MTLICQAEDFFSILGGLNASHWNLIGANPYIINRYLLLCLRKLSAKLCFSTAMFGPTIIEHETAICKRELMDR